MVETAQTAKISKREKWAKIKQELLKLPEKSPEIIAIAIDTKIEGVSIILSPVSPSYHSMLFDVGRSLRYKYNLPFENFNVYNLADFVKEVPWRENLINPGYKIIFEKKYEP